MSDVYKPPMSDVARPELPSSGGSIERSLSGEFQFEPFEVMREAWQLTDGVKLILLVGLVVALVATIVVELLVGLLMPPPTTLTGILLSSFVPGVAALPIAGPIYGGLMVVAIRHASGRPVAMNDLFRYDKIAPVTGVMLLTMLLTYIGMILLVLPGIYLAVAYFMALPLVVEKGMSPWQALETSRKVVTKCWWRMFFTLLVLGLIVGISAIPLLIPLIWTLPFWMLTLGVIYRNLFGVSTAG